jgi:hypothetical protein
LFALAAEATKAFRFTSPVSHSRTTLLLDIQEATLPFGHETGSFCNRFCASFMAPDASPVFDAKGETIHVALRAPRDTCAVFGRNLVTAACAGALGTTWFVYFVYLSPIILGTLPLTASLQHISYRHGQDASH